MWASLLGSPSANGARRASAASDPKRSSMSPESARTTLFSSPSQTATRCDAWSRDSAHLDERGGGVAEEHQRKLAHRPVEVVGEAEAFGDAGTPRDVRLGAPGHGEHALVGINSGEITVGSRPAASCSGEHPGAAPDVEHPVSHSHVGDVEHHVGPLGEQRWDEELVVDPGSGGWSARRSSCRVSTGRSTVRVSGPRSHPDCASGEMGPAAAIEPAGARPAGLASSSLAGSNGPSDLPSGPRRQRWADGIVRRRAQSNPRRGARRADTPHAHRDRSRPARSGRDH